MCPHEGSFLVSLPSDPLLGTLIDERYRVESLIAKGAVGSVYKGKQELLGRHVALKVLHQYLGADPESLVRFHREAKALSRLEHPNLLTIYDFGMTNANQPYFVMDLLDGETLANEINTNGPLGLKRSLLITKQVAEALAQAHKKGIVHRDIKPPNIVLTEKESAKDFVKLVDFSIAKISETTTEEAVQLTVDGIICGSPAYMSPEQCRGGEVDGRSDIYSIGIVLFEMLTGKRPFSAKDLVSLMYLHVNDAPPSLREVEPSLQFPEELEAAMKKILEKNPQNRPQDVSELWNMLEPVLVKYGDTNLAVTNQHPLPIIDSRPAPASSPLFSDPNRASSSSDSNDVFVTPNSAVAVSSSLSHSPIPAVSAQFSAEPMATAPRAGTALGVASQMSGDNLNVFDASPGSASGESFQPTAPTPRTVAKEYRNTSSHAEEVAHSYEKETEWRPSALRQILPFIFVLAAFTVGGLLVWDLATPDTPAELIVRGKTEAAINILENRQRTGRISAQELSTLHTGYLNLARKFANQKHYSQAIATLKKVPLSSPLHATASQYAQSYKHNLNMLGR